MRHDKTKSDKPVIDLESKDITAEPANEPLELDIEAADETVSAEGQTERATDSSRQGSSEASSKLKDKPAEKQASAGQFSGWPPRPEDHSSRKWLWALILLAVALLLGYWLYSSITSTQARLTQLEGDLKTLSQVGSEQQGLVAAQGKTLTSVTQNIQTTAKALTSLQDKVASSDASLENELAALKAQIGKPQGATGSSEADREALANLRSRVEGLEAQVAALKATPVPQPDARQGEIIALQQASSNLQEKIASGSGFSVEYNQLGSLLPKAASLATLAAYASAGLPNATQLAAELAAQMPTLSASLSEEESFTKRWGIDSIVTIREVDRVNWADIAAQAAKLAQAGDLKAAIAVITKEPAEKPAVLTSWVARASQRLELEEALRTTEQAVTQQLAQWVAAP